MRHADILVVEDDEVLNQVLCEGFAHAGFSVATAADGLEGMRLALRQAYRLIVLDVMLPGTDGFTIVKALRRLGDATPVLMLTARTATADVVAGLDAGAADYLAKPFSFRELLARVHGLLRRADMTAPRLRLGHLQLDIEAHRASCGSTDLSLAPAQFRLLEALLRAGGRVVVRAAIVDAVWGTGTWVSDNTLDVAISALRTTLERADAGVRLTAVRGFGYQLETA